METPNNQLKESRCNFRLWLSRRNSEMGTQTSEKICTGIRVFNKQYREQGGASGKGSRENWCLKKPNVCM